MVRDQGRSRPAHAPEGGRSPVPVCLCALPQLAARRGGPATLSAAAHPFHGLPRPSRGRRRPPHSGPSTRPRGPASGSAFPAAVLVGFCRDVSLATCVTCFPVSNIPRLPQPLLTSPSLFAFGNPLLPPLFGNWGGRVSAHACLLAVVDPAFTAAPLCVPLSALEAAEVRAGRCPAGAPHRRGAGEQASQG